MSLGINNGKDGLRRKLASQIDEFLSKGGKIQQCGAEHNTYLNQPIKRTRKEQVDYQRRFLKVRQV